MGLALSASAALLSPAFASAASADAAASATPSGVLTAVSCTAANSCEAVGTSGFAAEPTGFSGHAIAAKWNGTTWTTQSVSLPAGTKASELAGVSCLSSNDCFAVGTLSPKTGANASVIEKWNGTTWSTQTTLSSSSLAAVSCVTATKCEAVGASLAKAARPHASAATFDGSKWSAQVVAVPSPTYSSDLSAVSCFSAGCEAGGENHPTQFTNAPLIASLSGTAWSDPSIPAGGSLGGVVNGISCASANSCEAVGRSDDQFLDSARTTPYVIGWNGSSWNSQGASLPSGISQGSLLSVSCATATSCYAVGSSIGTSGPLGPLAESEGSIFGIISWSSQPVQDPSGGTYSFLNGVSCLAGVTCEAVGDYLGSTHPIPYADASTGSSWTPQTVP